MFKSILVAIAAAAFVSAENIVSITAPLSNNVYTAGGQAIITWINPTVDTISQIQLSQGPSTALQPVMTVAKNVSASDMQYTWQIPTTLAAGSDYAFVFGTSPNLSYTGQFTIKAADGSSPSSSAVSSGAASSSAAAPSSSGAAASSSAKSSASASSSSSTSASSSEATSAGAKVGPVAVSAMAVVGAAAIALM
ncbi:hypothetical protein BCR42DRAFT_401556 [Absidia repens]|uniref:Yeast cell wall synthesis Kre9/Knh1-like N-terminal domain-containing protein n=1 Tax=Absidia repens TaxID=90262 RepID=A0A1X2J2N7_9FUNG|nr:hypothetical protein BCR42DRAFT_401556 [Absidia repens]